MIRLRNIFQLLLALPILLSCSGEKGKFRIKGKYENIRQGEFYIYSTNGGQDELDTIKVENGVFDYTVSTLYPTTYTILYPNFSEQIVFGNSGEVVQINGDVKALRSVIVKGTPDNEEMTQFRLDNLAYTEENMTTPAEMYIRANPQSRVSLYLFLRYFVQSPKVDFSKNIELVDLLLAAQPDQEELWRYDKFVKNLVKSQLGEKLPQFSVLTQKGDTLFSESLKSKCTVINFWAAWYDQSRIQQRQLHSWRKTFKDSINLVSVSLDVDYSTLTRSVKTDSIDWFSVCDYQGWNSPLVELLSVNELPQMVIIEQNTQKILWRGSQIDSAQVVLNKQVDLYRKSERIRNDSIRKQKKRT